MAPSPHVRVDCPGCGDRVDTYEEGGVLIMVSHRDPAKYPAWCETGSDVPVKMPARPPVKLANESALGTYHFTWTSSDGVRMGVMWGEGMTGPMAYRGGVSRDVVRPERFGWKPPKTQRDFKAFAQAFAAEFEGGEITADSPADLGPEGERLAREEHWS